MQIYSSNPTKLAELESNDCTVRSIALAFETSYDRAHEFCEVKLRRRRRDGIRGFHTQMEKFQEKKIIDLWFGKQIKKLPNTYQCPKTKKTKILFIKRFIEDNPTGTFLVSVRGHCLVIKDSNVLDWDSFIPKIYREIKSIFEIK